MSAARPLEARHGTRSAEVKAFRPRPVIQAGESLERQSDRAPTMAPFPAVHAMTASDPVSLTRECVTTHEPPYHCCNAANTEYQKECKGDERVDE